MPTPGVFFGREGELAAIEATFGSGTRQVTLVGPGGVGKTALADRFAATNAGPTFSVSALGASTLSGVLAPLAGALGCPPPPRAGHQPHELPGDFDLSPASGLVDALAALERPLVVLDNAEPLAAALGPFCEHLLRRVPTLRLLATSRLPLGNAAEVRFPVGGLTEEAAIALFVHHARRARPYPPLSADALAACGALARRLGGHPLALMLAAGRLRVFSLEALERRLFPGDAPRDLRSAPPRSPAPAGLPLLAAGNGRHRSLTRVLEASVAALPDDLHRPLIAACAFRGGFSAPHFEAVGGSLEALEALVGCGLVYERAERFFPFETVREFLRTDERLLRVEAAEAHLHFYEQFAAERLPAVGAAPTIDELLREEPNIQEALDFSITCGPASVPLVLASTLVRIHPMTKSVGEKSPFEEGAALLARIPRDRVEASPYSDLFYSLRGDLFLEIGAMENAAGDFDALARSRDPAVRALAGTKLALLAEIAGDYAKAYRAYDRAIGDATQGNAAGIARAGIFVRRAHTLRRDGDLDGAAADLAAAALHLAEDGHATPGAPGLRADLSLEIAYEEAILLLLRGAFEAAELRLLEGEQLAMDVGAHVRHAAFVSARGIVALELGKPTVSAELQQQALAAYRRLGQRYGVGCTSLYLARAWTEMGRAEDAERAAMQALHEVRAVAIPRYEALALGLLASLARARDEQALARERIEEAEAVLARCPERSLATALELHRATVDGAGPGGRRWETLRESLSDDVRFAARLVARSTGAPPTILAIAPDGRRVDGPDGLAIDLQRRLPLARLVAALAASHAEAPREYLPMDRLIAAGWPGERMLFEAGKNRVQVALSELRALGLRPWIDAESGGYRLSPSVTVLVVPPV